MSDRLRFDNPGAVSNPLGLYSHCVTVPEGVELIFLSGQVGVRPDGTCGESVAEQADQVFALIDAVPAEPVTQAFKHSAHARFALIVKR
ncbi:MAG: RidA family protein, partial [Pseudomonadota bacterium]